MKKLYVIGLCISILVTGSCSKDKNDDQQQIERTREKLLGKWQLEKNIEEYYKPVDVLQDREETIGTPGDSVIFKKDNNVYSYQTLSAGVDEEVNHFVLMNDSLLIIDEEPYIIREITDHELLLWQDISENGERDIRAATFKR